MFTGSLRSNLDPFHEHDDATLWKVLHEVNHLFVSTVFLLSGSPVQCIGQLQRGTPS